ncbi:MAG: energy transducer TonB [Candidatus Krumholzibacteriia bacterium]
MSRGLPVSLLIHVLALTALLVLGGQVARTTPPLERAIRVRLTTPSELPALQEQPAAAPVAEPEPAPPEPQPERPRPQPELEPKQLPEKPREEPKPVEPEPVRPEPKTEQKPVEPTEDPPREVATAAAAATGDTTAMSAPQVATGADFPYAHYIDLVQRRVSTNWHPPPLNSYRGATRACVVEFVIGRGGQVTRVSLAASSGVSFFDREALAAVRASSPLPPLPARFGGQELPVSVRFTLKPGF